MINRRIVFSYDHRIALQYLPYFVLKKCPDNFPKPPLLYGHYAYFLDFPSKQVKDKFGITEYSYDLSVKPKIEDFKKTRIPDNLAQIDEDNRVLKELIFLINAISGKYIFQYGSKQSWFVTLDETQNSFYGQEGYNPPDYNLNPDSFEGLANYELTELPILDFSNSQGSMVQTLKLSDLFKIYFSSEKLEIKKKYLNACVILTKAYQLREIDMSASYVFLVSAIETLIEIEYENVKAEICAFCKMPHYEVRQKFIKFIDKFGYKVDKKTKDLFSNIRNRIVHKGELLVSSNFYKWTIENQEDLNAIHFETIYRNYYESFNNLVLTCFRTFLLFNLEKPSPNGGGCPQPK